MLVRRSPPCRVTHLKRPKPKPCRRPLPPVHYHRAARHIIHGLAHYPAAIVHIPAAPTRHHHRVTRLEGIPSFPLLHLPPGSGTSRIPGLIQSTPRGSMRRSVEQMSVSPLDGKEQESQPWPQEPSGPSGLGVQLWSCCRLRLPRIARQQALCIWTRTCNHRPRLRPRQSHLLSA